MLNLIEDEVHGNLSVYSFLHLKYDKNANPIGFEPLGKKAASTFFGFCGYHDSEIFKSIENNYVDIETDEHCFSLSYRAFAKDYHAKQETLKGFKSNAFYQHDLDQNLTGELVTGSEIGLRDGKFVKDRLNEILKNKKFEELEILTYTLDYMVPIALSASFNPEYSYSNLKLNKSGDPNVIYEFVNFVIQPMESGQTLILLSCLPEHDKSVKFMDQLANLKPLLFERAISSLAIAYIENTFFSPNIWKKLLRKEQIQLIHELHLTTPMARNTLNGFFHSKINLLDRRFKK